MSAVAAYDAIGARYGQLRAENRILAHMRAASVRTLLRVLPAGATLLELGAGDGEEALLVSKDRGSKVVAVEPAASLAAALRKRVAGGDGRVEVLEATTSAALESLAGRGETFDGAWSSFAIGYDAPLATLRPKLNGVLRPGAPLVVSVRNPWCLAEPWSIPIRATGRYRHKVGDVRVPVRHYSLRGVARALAPEFTLEGARGLPVLVPPPRYGRAWNRLGRLAASAERWDTRVSARRPWNALGDHTLAVFRRR